MKIFKSLGVEQQKNDQIVSLFYSTEGINAVYYGKTRNGKTRNATADIIELLKRGEVVFANWQVKFDGYDEREDKQALWVKLFFHKRYFFRYGPENFHYIDPIKLIDGTGEINIEFLNRLVGVHLFIDEGQWVLPSMDKTWSKDQVEKMKLVLHGGHYCRSLNIITQRHQNISKNTRSQINVWYRCVKRLDIFGLMIFQRFAIEDMKNDEPVEFDEEGRPLGVVKNYFVNKKHDPVFQAYNTHAMRQEDAIEVPVEYRVYKLSFIEKLRAIGRLMRLGRGRTKTPRPVALNGKDA
jgi:hypothetical protein